MESLFIPDCQACETALCDYIDGALAPELREAVESHLAQCEACAAYEVDIREGMGVLRLVDEAEAPPILVNRILYQIPQKESGLRGWLSRFIQPGFFEPLRQPRFVMGAMMTVLSLAMMTRCAGVPSRTLSAADLDPAKIVSAFDDRMHRTWDRSVKAYESMRVVYEVRERVHEWRQQQEAEDTAAQDAAANQALKTKQVPAHSSNAPAQK
jgi:anti-sigma factor RsiW